MLHEIELDKFKTFEIFNFENRNINKDLFFHILETGNYTFKNKNELIIQRKSFNCKQCNKECSVVLKYSEGGTIITIIGCIYDLKWKNKPTNEDYKDLFQVSLKTQYKTILDIMDDIEEEDNFLKMNNSNFVFMYSISFNEFKNKVIKNGNKYYYFNHNPLLSKRNGVDNTKAYLSYKNNFMEVRASEYELIELNKKELIDYLIDNKDFIYLYKKKGS